MEERLLSKHGPNSQKNAEETRKKLEGLHGYHRGWNVFLAAHDSLVEVLSKTPVRDTANNPVMQPVSIRPLLPVPPPTANIAAFIAYAAADAADQQAWDLLHPNDKTMNHRPTDTAIKNNVMLGSRRTSYFISAIARPTTPTKPGQTSASTSNHRHFSRPHFSNARAHPLGSTPGREPRLPDIIRRMP